MESKRFLCFVAHQCNLGNKNCQLQLPWQVLENIAKGFKAGLIPEKMLKDCEIKDLLKTLHVWCLR